MPATVTVPRSGLRSQILLRTNAHTIATSGALTSGVSQVGGKKCSNSSHSGKRCGWP
jgi:hypothetical protein